MSQAWIDNTTPLNSANMTKLVQEDEVVAAATRIIASKLLAADAQPAFRFFGDGKIEWGPGGATAPDVSLYRSAALTLLTNATLYGQRNLVANQGAASQVNIGHNNSGFAGGVFFGTATPADTNLYRDSAGVLKSDGGLNIVAQIAANQGAANQILLWTDGKLYFGSATDTNLYRSAANVLKTDDLFIAALGLTVTSQLDIGVSTGIYLPGPAAIAGGSSGPVSIGASNSGGAGFRLLLVPN
jgi:hypothetical protein